LSPSEAGTGSALALFRSEALAARQAPWLGTVLLAPRISHRLFTLTGAAAVLAVLALLFLAAFTRSVRVNGWLVPQQGVMQVLAPRPGVVTALMVKEGSAVRQGQPLLALSDELQTAALGATEAEVGRRLGERSDSLRAELQQQQQLLRQQQTALGQRLAALQSEKAQIEHEIELLRSRVAIASDAETLQRQMRDQGFIAEPRFQQARAERLEQQGRLGALERSRTTIERERLVVEGDLRDLPLKIEKDIGLLARNLSQVEQERAQSEARREIVVTAPQDGVATAIAAVLGGRANISLPLLSIVPQNARLEAHLYGPSRAIGFVRPGQLVRLRYQAYPYQRFGHQQGELASVSRSAIGPGELPPPLAGLVNTVTTSEGGAGAEPMYRLTVNLASQAVNAYGEAMPLQSGMLLEADVMLERRRLFEWVLDPLYTLTGKWP
jgi:membrane fusion protein